MPVCSPGHIAWRATRFISRCANRSGAGCWLADGFRARFPPPHQRIDLADVDDVARCRLGLRRCVLTNRRELSIGDADLGTGANSFTRGWRHSRIASIDQEIALPNVETGALTLQSRRPHVERLIESDLPDDLGRSFRSVWAVALATAVVIVRFLLSLLLRVLLCLFLQVFVVLCVFVVFPVVGSLLTHGRR